MPFVVGAMLLAIVTAIACAVPGIFIVLRRESMIVDAISHAILPGIVLGYALTHDLTSPLLLVGAGLAGLVVVAGANALTRTGMIAGDGPLGLTFPALFSVGIIMISARYSDIHLDTHAVLAGDLNLAAFTHLTVGGIDVGPRYLYVMAAIGIIGAGVLALLWRPLRVATFDPHYARFISLPTVVAGAALMVVTAVTVTAAFHAAGAILVLALTIAPPATAHLVTDRLRPMTILTVGIAAGGAAGGFALAYALDAPTSAGMAVFYGLIFAATWAARAIRGRRSSTRLLALQLAQPHETPAGAQFSRNADE